MFDPLLKTLCDDHPRPWVDLICRSAGLPTGVPGTPVKASIPAKALEADRAYRLELPEPVVVHVEFESAWQSDRPGRFFVYNTLLERDQQRPVLTVVILLRPRANSSDLTGERRCVLPDGAVISFWNYRVIRLWELPAELAMASPWTMPLAPLMDVSREEVVPLAERMLAAFQQLPEHAARELSMGSSVLAGLRFDEAFAQSLFSGVGRMKESTVYQAIHQEGLAEGAEIGELLALRRMLLRLGQRKLGSASEAILTRIEEIDTRSLGERLIDGVDAVGSWDELFANFA